MKSLSKRPKTDSPEAVIGRRINELRDKAGLTYDELAERIGISKDGVKKMLDGSGTAQYVKLKTVAAALGCTPNDILGVSSGGHDQAVFRQILELTYETLGLSEIQAAALAKTVEEVLQAPPLRSGRLDPGTSALVQAELAMRRFAKSKPS